MLLIWLPPQHPIVVHLAVLLAAIPFTSVCLSGHSLETHTFVNIINPGYLLLVPSLLLTCLQINLLHVSPICKDHRVRPRSTTSVLIVSLPAHLLGVAILRLRPGILPLSRRIVGSCFLKLQLLAPLVRHLRCAQRRPVAASRGALSPALLLRNHLRQLVVRVLVLALVWPLEARETATDVLAHLLHHCGLFALVCARLEGEAPLVVHAKDLQFLNADLGGSVGCSGAGALGAQWLVGELLRGKAIALLGVVVCLLDGLQLLVHPPHVLVGASLFVRDSAACGGPGHRGWGLACHLGESGDDVAEESDLPLVALIRVLVVHYFYDFSHLLVALELGSLEVKIVAQLSKAHWAESEGLLVGLVQLRGTIHEALVRLAVTHREDMAQLVAGRLDRSVLHELGHR